jgi:PAS domain S-box-containing protein
MKANKTKLSRLVTRSAVESLFTPFLALAPDTGVALVNDDGQVVARSGSWSSETLGELARYTSGDAWIRDMADAEMIERGPFRFYRLLANTLPLGAVIASGPSSALESAVERAMHQCVALLVGEAFARREVATEALERYRELSLLYRISDTIGSLLDPGTIADLVLKEVQSVVAADAGVVLLVTPEGDWVTRGGFGESAAIAALHDVAWFVLEQSLDSGRPAIIGDLPGSASLYHSALWAPKRTGDRLLGGILLGRFHGQPMFAASDQKLLSLLAGQASLSMENARLFDNLQRTLEEAVATKNLLANIVASIPSGLITTDALGRVTHANDAAREIFGVAAEEMTGKSVQTVLPQLYARVRPALESAIREGRSTPAVEHSLLLRGRGALHLSMSCTPLRETDGSVNGATLVVRDLTEQRGLEAERQRLHAAFGRVVAPQVRDRMLAHSENQQLDGARQIITVLFADIRHFTPYSERTPPEVLFKVLNSYLSLASKAILAFDGTLDKFIGDAVMAFWNAPNEQPDHARRAVLAGLEMQRNFKAHHAHLDAEHHLEFRIGIATGVAMLGNVGASNRFNYTAIGDTVNLAQRLESVAKPGQIVLSEATFQAVAEHVTAKPLGPVQLRGRSAEEMAYAVEGSFTGGRTRG